MMKASRVRRALKSMYVDRRVVVSNRLCVEERRSLLLDVVKKRRLWCEERRVLIVKHGTF